MGVLAGLRAAWDDHAALDRPIWTLAALRAINTIGLSLILAFVGLYLIDVRGLPATAYGAVALVVNLAQTAASHWAGQASDRLGRVRVMLWAQLIRCAVVGAIGACLYGRAPIPLIVALMIANGWLRGSFEPVASALVADVAPVERRVAAFGLQRMGVNLGWVIGPAAGGFLTDALGYGPPVLLSVPFLIAAAVVTARMEEPPRPAAQPAAPIRLREAVRAIRGRPQIALLLLGGFLFSVAHIQQFTTLQTYARVELGISFSQIGLLYTVNGLGVLLLQIPAVAVIHRLRPDRAQIAAALLWLLAYLLFGAASGPLGLALAVVVMTSGEVLLSPAQQATMAELGDPAAMGRAFGALGTAQNLGISAAPLLGGLAYDHLRHEHLAMWGALAIAPLVMLVVYVRFAALRRLAPLPPSIAAAHAAAAPVGEVIGPPISGPNQR